MFVVNYTTVKNNFEEYCDKACNEDEIVVVTRKAEKNVVIISLDRLNQLEKEVRNARYLAKIEEGFSQIEAGRGISHELIEE